LANLSPKSIKNPFILTKDLTRRGMSWGFNFEMQIIWSILNLLTVGIFFMNILLNTWYGNKSEPKVGMRIWHTIKVFIIICALYVAFVVLISLFMSNINFRVHTRIGYTTELALSTEPYNPTTYEKTEKIYQTTSDILFSLFVPVAMIGSLCFGIFGGAGMIVLPMKLILAYVNQPTRPNAEEHVLAKMILNKWSERLIKKGIDVMAMKKDLEVNKIPPLQRKMKEKEMNKEADQLERDVMELMGVFDIFKREDNIVDNNPLVYLAFLIVGLFFLGFSLLFIAHTVLSTQGFYVIIESVFSGVEGLSTILSLIIFIIFNVFVGLAIVNGSYQMLKPLGGILGIKPMKLNQTWTNSFLTNNNIMMCAMIGSIIYFMKYCPNYFRFLKAELQFNKLIIRLSVVDPIYAYNIPEYLFLLFAIVALFVIMFEKSPKAIMAQKVEEEKIKMEEERERLEGKKDDGKEEEKKE
jgi:hypothetical protein